MDVLNYTPLDQSRLETFYRPAHRSRKMDVIFVAIGLLTTMVIGLVIYILYNRAQVQQIVPKKMVPSITPMPTETSVPTETPTPTIIPVPEPGTSESSSSGDFVPEVQPETIPQDEIPIGTP